MEIKKKIQIYHPMDLKRYNLWIKATARPGEKRKENFMIFLHLLKSPSYKWQIEKTKRLQYKVFTSNCMWVLLMSMCMLVCVLKETGFFLNFDLENYGQFELKKLQFFLEI